MNDFLSQPRKKISFARFGVAKTVVFKSGASRTSKLSCTLILLEIKPLFGWSDKSFTTWEKIAPYNGLLNKFKTKWMRKV